MPEPASPEGVVPNPGDTGRTAAAPSLAEAGVRPAADAGNSPHPSSDADQPGVDQQSEGEQEEVIDFDNFIEEKFPGIPAGVRATYKFLYDKLRGEGVVKDDQDRRLITDEAIKVEIVQKL